MFHRECLHRRPGCRIEYSGQQDGLHILSSQTAAGDEIGWDFVNTVSKSQISLSAYCSITSDRYYSSTAAFMSRQTFTDWVFSWMSNFKIDFRQACDQCKFNPKIMACDGTQLGMFFRNVSLSSFDKPTCKDTFTPSHKQTARQFFSYSEDDSKKRKEASRQAKVDLQYFVAKNKNALTEWANKQAKKAKKGAKNNSRTEDDRKKNLLRIVSHECHTIVSKFINKTFQQEILHSLCPVMEILASDCPLTSLLNYRFLDVLSEILEGSLGIEKLNTQMPEICNLLEVAGRSGALVEMKSFLKYLVKTIYATHSHDKEHSVSTILEPYNPELQGRAYYFTPHGGRVRDLPSYDISKSSKKDTLGDQCRKSFVSATKSGTTYLFLWFDPLHGHCYGFHVITTSEGRKDPFASAYMYMDTAPDEVFYDFSCQLEEYALNREPKFWRNCRFYHDIFHGFSHKCPYVYMSRRIPALNIGINSEICEQFNSYIQKIKHSARAMNQSHFTFYLQYFIHRWNVQKHRKFKVEQKMAHSLLM